jgi:fructose-1-phosphate kinase PfkB-like protein
MQYRVEILNMFAALENLNAEVDINRAWENIRENNKISAKESLDYYELKEKKPLLDEEYPEILDQRIEAKLQWLQNPSEMGII